MKPRGADDAPPESSVRRWRLSPFMPHADWSCSIRRARGCSSSRRAGTSFGCGPSPLDITATSRIAPTRRAVPSSSCWRCSVGRRCSRDHCGGRAGIVATTSTPTDPAIRIHRPSRASGTRTSGGSSTASMARRTCRTSGTSPRFQSWAGSIDTATYRSSATPCCAWQSRVPQASSGDSRSARSCSCTRHFSSTRSHTCGALAATRPPTRRATTRSSPCSRSARAGTTTTTTTCRRRVRASGGGRSMSPTTRCACWRSWASSGTYANLRPGCLLDHRSRRLVVTQSSQRRNARSAASTIRSAIALDVANRSSATPSACHRAVARLPAAAR